MVTYGVDPKQFLLYIVRPVERRIELWSQAAEVLVLGSALQESHLRWIDQIDKASKPGPAFGPFQMEGPTHADLHKNFLNHRPGLKYKVLAFAGHYSGTIPDPGEMVGNWFYAAAMCRVHYLRMPARLPAPKDARAMAEYYKKWYNTPLGKAKVEECIPHFEFAYHLSDLTKEKIP